jgi:hypothetical protein
MQWVLVFEAGGMALDPADFGLERLKPLKLHPHRIADARHIDDLDLAPVRREVEHSHGVGVPAGGAEANVSDQLDSVGAAFDPVPGAARVSPRSPTRLCRFGPSHTGRHRLTPRDREVDVLSGLKLDLSSISAAAGIEVHKRDGVHMSAGAHQMAANVDRPTLAPPVGLRRPLRMAFCLAHPVSAKPSTGNRGCAAGLKRTAACRLSRFSGVFMSAFYHFGHLAAPGAFRMTCELSP